MPQRTLTRVSECDGFHHVDLRLRMSVLFVHRCDVASYDGANEVGLLEKSFDLESRQERLVDALRIELDFWTFKGTPPMCGGSSDDCANNWSCWRKWIDDELGPREPGGHDERVRSRPLADWYLGGCKALCVIYCYGTNADSNLACAGLIAMW